MIGLKVLWVTIWATLVVIGSAIMGAVFVWLGWNHVRHLFDLGPITVADAFWLCLLLRTLLSVTIVNSVASKS